MAVSDNLKNVVENNDVLRIRSTFYTIILSDPMFQTGKFDEALLFVKKHNIVGLIDEHDDEILKPENEWNEEYFDLLASKLQDNFSEERIEQIKKVAKKINTLTHIVKEENIVKEKNVTREDVHKTETQKCTSNFSNEKNKDKENDDFYTLLGILGLVVATFLMIRHIFKGDK